MSQLKRIRELQNLTQEELSVKCGISVRTIQRIESGKNPKGYTLRVLAKELNVEEIHLLTPETVDEIDNFPENQPELNEPEEEVLINYSLLKLINLSSIPFTVIPPLNIIVPLILMLILKQKNGLTKQLISIQMIWTISAPIVFMLGIFLKPGHNFTLILMILIAFPNIFIILRNAIEIDRNKKLRYRLNFSMT